MGAAVRTWIITVAYTLQDMQSMDSTQVLQLPQSIDSLCTIPSSSSDMPLIAMCGSSLGGNVWDGYVGLVELSQDLCHVTRKEVLRIATGCSSMVAMDDHLVVARDDGDISIHATAQGRNLAEVDLISAHDGIVSCLALNSSDPSVPLLCSGGHDSSVILWDMTTASEQLLIPSAHAGSVYGVAFQPSHASLFASVGYDGFLRVWDSRQGADVADIANLGQIGTCITYSESGILVGLVDGRVVRYDARKLQATSAWAAEGIVRSIRLSKGGDLAVAAGTNAYRFHTNGAVVRYHTSPHLLPLLIYGDSQSLLAYMCSDRRCVDLT